MSVGGGYPAAGTGPERSANGKVTENTLKDKTAIVGVGATPYYKRGQSLPQTPMELAGKAVLAALDDAGLPSTTSTGSRSTAWDSTRRCSRSGSASPRCASPRCLPAAGAARAGSVGLASAAIVSGMAECVVSVMTLQQAASRFGASFAPRGDAGRGLLRAAVAGGQLHSNRRA